MNLASVNGIVVPAAEAHVSVLDNGFAFGDSVYEVMRTYGRSPFEPGRHFRRLRASAARLGFEIPPTDAELLGQVDALLAKSDPGESYVRIVVSRGVGDCSYDFSRIGTPTVVMVQKPLPAYPARHYEEGIRVAAVDVRRNHPRALDPAIKSSNLLNNLLAWRAGRRLGVYEPILLDAAGMLAEGASSNLFLVREGKLLTPALGVGLLRGITREVVLELAHAHGIPVSEEVLPAAALGSADEAFLTSTLKGVLAIRRVDGWPIREGRPGPLTRRLADLYDALAQEETKAGSAPGASHSER